MGCIDLCRAVTNFSSRRGIEKSSLGTKKSGAAAELAGWGGGVGTVEVGCLGKYTNFS